MPSGLVDGVTTNPSLIAKSGKDMGETIKTICSIVSGPVSAEVTATEYDKMLEEGEYLASLAKNVAVKVPLTPAGLQTCKALREKDIMVNVTLCFSAAQALLAAKVGATFISPFVGRLDELKYYTDAEIIWAQEEPKNMGAWGFVKGRLESVMQEAKVKQEKIFYVGRSPAASPAAGSLERHLSNQETIIKMATEDSISKIIKSWAGISTKLKTNLPIE